ncbi:unnamed protein product, partial [Echinostoma caproni]|uniref:Testicular haploid expressed gene protein n=1 Tax=Echinostoma caproni TaxID=27848 RepID=A0A183B3T0_9TREM
SAILAHLADSVHQVKPESAFKVIYRVPPHPSKSLRLHTLAAAEAIGIRLFKPNLCAQKRLAQATQLPWPKIDPTDDASQLDCSVVVIKRRGTDFSFPDISHPNYRALDWGPEPKPQRYFRRIQAFSQWEDVDFYHHSWTPCDSSIKGSNFRQLFQKYQEFDATELCYRSFVSKELARHAYLVKKQIKELIGCPRVVLNSKKFLRSFQESLQKRYSSLCTTAPGPVDERAPAKPSIKLLPVGTVWHLPQSYHYDGTVKSRTRTVPRSNYTPRSRGLGFRPQRELERASSMPSKSSSIFEPCRKSNISGAKQLLIHTKSEPETTDAFLKRVLSVESKQITYLYNLAELALTLSPVGSNYRIYASHRPRTSSIGKESANLDQLPPLPPSAKPRVD